jgi:thiamine-phosphate pyrophosphorylase
MPDAPRPDPALWRLVLITDRTQARRDLLEVVAESCAAGIGAVQLREKDLSDKDYFLLARRVLQITRPRGVPLIINNSVATALALETDGVHLGGRSMPLDAARRLMPSEMLLGASTHTLEEVRVANEIGADYLTFGPVYDTPSKRGLVSTTGLDPIRELKRVTSMPIFALGGVKRANLPDVLAAGFDGAAVISEIMAAERPGQVVSEMRAISDEFAARREQPA